LPLALSRFFFHFAGRRVGQRLQALHFAGVTHLATSLTSTTPAMGNGSAVTWPLFSSKDLSNARRAGGRSGVTVISDGSNDVRWRQRLLPENIKRCYVPAVDQVPADRCLPLRPTRDIDDAGLR
jgi:hypothetical protein